MKHLLRYVLCGILFSMTVWAHGQNLKGRVLDENNRPIEFANIVILSADSTFIAGSTSDAEGRFELVPDIQGKLIRISFVGYDNTYLPYRTGNVGDVHLALSSQMLQETVVTAKRPKFQLTAEGMKTQIAGSVLSEAGNASDVLSKLPNVDGGGGNFSVFGKGKAVIYLNGRPLYDSSVLSRLSSTDIEQVEVISNPGAKYANTIKAVIRIKTKKKVGDGLSGNVQGAFSQGHRSDYTGMVYLNYRKNKVDVFGSFYFTDGYRKQEQTNIQNIYGKSQQNSYSDILSHFRSFLGAAGVNYEINSKHSLGVQYTVNKQPADAEMQSDMLSTTTDGQEENLHYDTEVDMPSGVNHSLNAYYMGKVGSWTIDFNTDALFRQSQKNQYTREYVSDILHQEITTFNQADANMVAAKLVLSRPIGKGTLSFGGEYTRTHRTNVFHNVQSLLTSTDDKIIEGNASAFAEYTLPYKNWTFNAGLRFQNTISDYYESDVRIAEQSRKYNDLLPNLSVGSQWGDLQAQLSYTAKKTRPSYYMLDSNVQYDNRYMYESGNPLIQPATYHDLSLNLSYSWLYASVSYLRMKDELLNVYRMYNDEAILFTYDNFDKVDEINAQISASPKIKFWQPTYSVQVSRQFIDEEKLGIAEPLDKPIFRFKLYNAFTLPWDMTARADFMYVTNGNSGTSYNKHYAQLNVSLSKWFLKKKLQVHIQGSDILKTSYRKSFTYSPYHSDYRDNYSDSRKVYVVFRYFFNSTKSKYKGRGAGNEEKGRL